MKDLIVLFVDRREKIYKVYENQTAYSWTQIKNEMNQMRYTVITLGGSRKEIHLQEYIEAFKHQRFLECKGEIDFSIVSGKPRVE